MTKDEIFDKIDEVYSEHDGGTIYLSEERTNQIKEIIQQAINFTPCCETLKTKKAPTFEHWLICNFEETKTGKYIDFNNGDTYRDKQVLKLKYNKIFKPTL